MTTKSFLRSLASAALLGALSLMQPAAAQQVPGAYGPNGIATVPLYAGLLGSYSKSLTSGTMAAALAANSPVFSFRYGGSNVGVVRSVVVSATDITTGFAATNATFQMFAARAFTASDTGGSAATLTGNNGKMRTSFATTAVSDIRISSTATLTAGTRTLDTDPLAALTGGPTATAGNPMISAGTAIYLPTPNEYPLVLATNEGFVIQATVPATGTWVLTVTVTWDEYASF